MIKWFRNMLWKNPLPVLFALTILLLIILLPFPANAKSKLLVIKWVLIFLYAGYLLYSARSVKPTQQGIYLTFLGIPYRFVAKTRVSSVRCFTVRRQKNLIISFDGIPSFCQGQESAYGYMIKNFPHYVTVGYSERNKRILMEFYGRDICGEVG